MRFKVGEHAAHKSLGIGVISGIETREFTKGDPRSFYIMVIQDNGWPKKVFVPVETAETRLRPLLDKTTARDVVEYLREGQPDPELHTQGWNSRCRTYTDLLASGTPMDVARVYVSLNAKLTARRGVSKDLSYGERVMLEQAKSRLANELDLVVGTNYYSFTNERS